MTWRLFLSFLLLVGAAAVACASQSITGLFGALLLAIGSIVLAP